MAKDFFDTHIEVMSSDKKLADAIKNRMKKMLPERLSKSPKKEKFWYVCMRCVKTVNSLNKDGECVECVKEMKEADYRW